MLPIPLELPQLLLAPLSGVAELAGKWLLEFDIVDLVLWFPYLSWAELGRSLAAVVALKLATDQVDRILSHRLRIWLADVLIRLAGWVRPA